MGAIILFDGVCNFCNGTVNFVIERDKAGYFKFAPLHQRPEKAGRQYGISRIETDSVILIEDGKLTLSTAACLSHESSMGYGQRRMRESLYRGR